MTSHQLDQEQISVKYKYIKQIIHENAFENDPAK